MSGSYGATQVECEQVTFGSAGGTSFADYRAWLRVLEVIRELFP